MTRASSRTTSFRSLDESTACVIVEPIAANMGLDRARARVPARIARRVRSGGRAAGLRRGDHRLPRRPRRRARSVRRSARPHVLRQGDRRRSAGRCVWRPSRCDVVRRAAGTRVPSGNACRGIPLAMAAGLAALDLLDDRRLRHARRHRGSPGRRAGEGVRLGRRGRRACRSKARWSACSSAQKLPVDYAGAAHNRRPGRTLGSSTRCSTRVWRSHRARTRSCSRDSRTTDPFSTTS